MPQQQQQHQHQQQTPRPGSFTSISVVTASPSSVIASSPPLPPPPPLLSRPLPPPPVRIDSSDSDDPAPPPITKSRSHGFAAAGTHGVGDQRPGTAEAGGMSTPIYSQFMSHANGSSASLAWAAPPRPAPMTARSALDVLPPSSSSSSSSPSPLMSIPSHIPQQPRITSPLPPQATMMMPPHTRKLSATQGMFTTTLPHATSSNLSQIDLALPTSSSSSSTTSVNLNLNLTAAPGALSASQIAAQTAVARDHLREQQLLHQYHHHQYQNYYYLGSHSRQRSQTVPGGESVRPTSPPVFSLTEASGPPRDGPFLAYHTPAATAAANVVFPRSPSGQGSPSLPPPPPPPQLAPSQPPPPLDKKPDKPEKSSKVKLFSKARPSKVSTARGDPKDKPLPSPGTTAKSSLLSALQRGNFSTTSLDSSHPFYHQNNASQATIRPADVEGAKDGEKKHRFFLTKHKHSKEEFSLGLSSAASNSRPIDPSAPNTLYNFNPQSPAPTSSSFPKSIHAARKDKKAQDDGHGISDWPAAPGSATALSAQSSLWYETFDPTRYGLTNMSADDAWPYLKAKLQAVFEGEDLRIPVEDLNRVVALHLQYCLQRRTLSSVLDDLWNLLDLGFSSMDHTLKSTPEDRLIPTLVELWLFTFTSILPYLQAIFLPLDIEFSGSDQAREFLERKASFSGTERAATPHPTAYVGSDIVRRLILTAYRDRVILPRYDSLRHIFSRLSLDCLPASLTSNALSSPPLASETFPPMPSSSPAESFFSMARPGTALSIDPSLASYNSTSTTLLGDTASTAGGGGSGGRSRAISNVSFGSASASVSDGGGGFRPFTPSSLHVLGEGRVDGRGVGGATAARDQNIADDSKQVTDLIGRLLQCMSVLASLGVVGEGTDVNYKKIEELCKKLKLNWLGRGRTGRIRLGMVGGRVRRGGGRVEISEELRVASQ